MSVKYVMPHLLSEGDEIVIEQFGNQFETVKVTSKPESDGYQIAVNVSFNGEARRLLIAKNSVIAVKKRAGF